MRVFLFFAVKKKYSDDITFLFTMYFLNFQ